MNILNCIALPHTAKAPVLPRNLLMNRKSNVGVKRPFFTALRSLFALLILASFFSHSASNNWYQVSSDNIVTLDTHYGPVTIALEPDLAPNHVKRFRNLIKNGFYNQRYFYRVVDGFVAQGGSNETHEVTPATDMLKAEFTVPLAKEALVVEENDMFAPATGFYHGFAVGIDKTSDTMWALHCPGTVAFARDNDKDTGSTEFYIVIGQAPRHLDRNMSVVGRVVAGMPVLQQLPRGDKKESGFIASPTEDSKITGSYIGTKANRSAQPSSATYYMQLPTHDEYLKRTDLARNLNSPFYHNTEHAPRPVDVCYYQTKASTSVW